MASPVLAAVEIPIRALQSDTCMAEGQRHLGFVRAFNLARQSQSWSPVLDTASLSFQSRIGHAVSSEESRLDLSH
jgi:hypothetical protein